MGVLDTPPEPRFDAITTRAAKTFGVPICTISVIDANREWFKSCVGTLHREGERSTSFCGHTIVSGKILIVEDALKDPRFADNPQVVNPPHVRFYAGVTLFDRKTHIPVGAFCIKDTKARSLDLDELNVLMDLARQAEEELNHGIQLSDIEDRKPDTSMDRNGPFLA